MPLIELPEGKGYLRVPAGLTDAQALSLAKEKFPFLYKDLNRGIGERAVSSAVEGVGQLGETASGLSAGIQSLFGGREGVQKYIDAQKKEQEESGKKPRAITLQNLIDQGRTDGILPALSNVPAYLTEQVLQSAPSMAVPLAAGLATTAYSAPLLGPLAPVAGTLAGIGTYGLQTFASNTQAQALTPGRTAETMEPGKALGAAAVAAPLGFLVDRWILGLGKVPAKTAVALMEKETAARGVGKTLAVGAAKGLLEVPTELLETALERAQAGLSLTDKDAKAAFLETMGSALAVGSTAGAGFAYRERGQARAAGEEASQATAMQERNQARMDALKQDQEQKLSPEYRDTLLQERAPLMQRMEELKAIKKAAGKNGKELDSNEYAALQDELKTVGQSLAANTRGLKEIEAPIPLEQGKKSMAQIQEELRVKAEAEQQAAQKKAADKAEAERLKAPPQADMFGSIISGKYSELPPKSIERITGLRAPEAAVEETPNLPEEYRKAKAESDRLADTMEAASAKKDWTGYEAARTQRVPFEDAIKALETEAAKQQVSLVPQPSTSAPTVEDINKKIQKLADQGKSVASLLPQLQAAKTAPVQQGIQGLEPQDIAAHQKVIAEAKAAAEKEAKERGLITDDFGNIVSGKEAQQLGLNIPAAEKAQAQSLANPVMENRSRAQKHIDEGRITPEVSKYLGLDVPQKYNLSQPEQAQQALPIISARIADLSAQSRSLSQQGDHVVDGLITPSGNELLALEVKIKELQRLQRTAQDSAPTKTEERLVSNVIATSPVTAPTPEAVAPGIARIRGDKAEQERRAALAYFVESIDTLRKGDFTDVPKNEVIRYSTELAAKYVDAMLREAAYRRMERQRGSVTQDEAIKAASAVDARLQKLIDEAASRPREAPGMLGAAIEKSTEPQSKKVFEAARAVAKLQERIRKAGPTINVAELRAQLAEARQRFAEEKSKYLPSQRKQDEIKRGMTISETKANFGNTEYTKIRGELGRVAYELAYPSGKKQVFKTPFDLKPSPAAAPARAATDVSTLRSKVEALLSKKDISAEDLRTVRTMQAQIAQSEATQAGGKDRIAELRGQADTLANEMARLKKRYETSKNKNERKKLRKLGERYNDALTKVNAEILALREKTGVGERPGVSEGNTVDMFKKLERQEEAAQRLGEEKKETYSPAVKAMFAEATKLRKNLHSLFDSTIKKYDAAVKDLTARYKQYEGIGSYANRFAQEAAAAQAVKDKALKGINTGLGRANRILDKAEELHKQETAVAEKKKSVEEAKQKKTEERRQKAQAKPAAKPAPIAKKLTVAEAEESAQRRGLTQRYEVTDAERVKRLPEGTELADIEADRAELSQKIRALGAQLGMEPRAALRPKIELAQIPTERERKINNIRLGLIEKYEELGQQLVMPVSTKVEAKEKPAGGETSEEMAGRVIPRQYAIALFDVQQVRDALKQKGIPPAKRKELEAKRKMLNSKIMALEARAKAFDVNLSERVRPEETALAQAKAVKEGLAADARQPPVRNPYLKTGSEEQKQAKAEGLERKKRGRQAKKGIEYEETETDIRNEESAILAGLVGHKGIVDFRLATTADTGVDMTEAADVVARVKAALPAGVDFIYAPTLAQVPADLRAAMDAQGHAAIKGAVLPDGRVVVVGEAHSSIADLQKSISHELIGHYGVDVILGKDGVQALTDKLFAKGNDHVAQVATGLGVFGDAESAISSLESASSEAQAAIKTALVREMIAHAAEGARVAPKFVDKVTGFIKDVISAVRGFFRSMGMSSAAKMDTKEIQALVKEATRALASGRLGAYESPTGAVAFKAKMPAGFEAVQDFAAAAIAKKQGLLATIKSRSNKQNALAFKVAEIDRLAAIEEMADQAIKAGNGNEAMQMMYFLQKQLDMLSMASASAYTGALDLVEENGEFRIQAKEGASLRTTDQALKPLTKMGFNAEGAENLFTAYIASLRGEQEGYNKLNFNPKVIKMAQEVVPGIKANLEVKAVLDLARAEYNEYNKGQIRFLEKTGAITPKLAAELMQKKDFIPYYRDVGGQLSLFIGSGNPVNLGNLKSQPHLQKLVGGDEKIMSYFESSMQNTLILTDLSLRNLATKNTAHAFHTFGVLETTKGNDGKEHAIRLGDGPANVNVLHFKDKGVEKHVVVKTEGTAYEGIPTELLVKGMEGTAIVMPKAIEILSIPAQVLRKGITLAPLYPYYQLVKDSMAMGVTRGVSFSDTASIIKAVKQYINGGDLIKELQSKGVIFQAEMLTGTMSDVAKIRNRLVEGEGKLHKFIAGQEARAVKADGAVRAMLYSHYIKDGLSPRDAEYMTIKAMPYSRRGLDPTLRYLSQMTPFFNAQIVGLYSLYQSLRGQGPMSGKLQIKKKLYTAGMSMAVGTLIYSALVSGEDWYENMPLETRLRNWLIKLPGSQEPIAIPIPFEFGIIFKSVFEAIYMGAFRDSPEGAKVRDALRKVILGSVPGGTIPLEAVPVIKAVPMPIPTIAQPLLSLAFNRDAFSNNPIEGERELGVNPAERFRDTTSEAAKRLGRLADVSPMQIDYLIRGYTGTVGPAVIALVDALTGPANAAAGVKQELPASKLPFLNQIFKPADGGALIDLAVDSLKQADQTRKTYEKIANDGRYEEAEAYLEKNQFLIERGKLAGKLRQRLGLYAKAERDIKASDSTPLEKRRALEDLKQYKIQESKDFMQEFRAGA